MIKINNSFRLALVLVVSIVISPLISAETPIEMRSRFLNVLTNQEVEEYLERNDIIFVPVGVTEMHGALPLDAEAVLPQAFALKMAEQVDGIVLGNLPFFYAGATTSGRGTVQLSVRDGIDHLQALAHSLLRQGFRRQVYVSFHSPAHLTVSPVVRDFFDETSVPILYIDLVHIASTKHADLFKSVDSMYSIFFAAYDIVDRLGDVPLTSAKTDRSAPSGEPFNTLTQTLSKLAPSSGAVGYYFPNHSDHALTPIVETPKQRQSLADSGKVRIESILKELDVTTLVKRLRELDQHLQQAVIPKYGELLPSEYNQSRK